MKATSYLDQPPQPGRRIALEFADGEVMRWLVNPSITVPLRSPDGNPTVLHKLNSESDPRVLEWAGELLAAKIETFTSDL